MAGLVRNNHDTKEGKYLVRRRNGTLVRWPLFVLGARDPAAPAALRAYADEAAKLCFDQQYVTEVRELAGQFDQYRIANGAGDPDAKTDVVDNPATVAEMRRSMDELKHSIKVYLVVMHGPTAELASYLMKSIDFIEDTDFDRRDRETKLLAFTIIQEVMFQVIKPVPYDLSRRVLTLDPISAKYALLKVIIEALRVSAPDDHNKIVGLTGKIA